MPHYKLNYLIALLFLCTTTLVYADNTTEKTIEEYANQIHIDYNKVEDNVFPYITIEKQFAMPLYAIPDPYKRIEVYHALRQKAPDDKKDILLSELEQSLIISYLESPTLKDAPPLKKCEAIYALKNDGLIDFEPFSHIADALIFEFLTSSEYQNKGPIERLQFIQNIEEENKTAPSIFFISPIRAELWKLLSKDSKESVIENLNKHGLEKISSNTNWFTELL